MSLQTIICRQICIFITESCKTFCNLDHYKPAYCDYQLKLRNVYAVRHTSSHLFIMHGYINYCGHIKTVFLLTTSIILIFQFSFNVHIYLFEFQLFPSSLQFFCLYPSSSSWNQIWFLLFHFILFDFWYLWLSWKYLD